VQGPVLGCGTNEQVKTSLPHMPYAPLPAPVDQPVDENLRRMMTFVHQHMIEKFETMKRGINPQLQYHDQLQIPGNFRAPTTSLLPATTTVNDVGGIARIIAPAPPGQPTSLVSQMHHQAGLGVGGEQASRMMSSHLPSSAAAAFAGMPSNVGRNFDPAAVVAMTADDGLDRKPDAAAVAEKASRDAGRKQVEMQSRASSSVSGAASNGVGVDRPELGPSPALSDAIDVGAGDAALPASASVTPVGGWAGWQKPKAEEPENKDDSETAEDAEGKTSGAEEETDDNQPEENGDTGWWNYVLKLMIH